MVYLLQRLQLRPEALQRSASALMPETGTATMVVSPCDDVKRPPREDDKGDPVQSTTSFEVRYDASSVFTEREEIGKTTTKLTAYRTTLNSQQKSSVIHGQGGSGKIQVCLKLAEIIVRSRCALYI